MNPTLIFYILIAILSISQLFSWFISYLESKQWQLPYDDDCKKLLTEEQFEKAKNYAADRRKFGFVSSLFSFVFMLGLFLVNAFSLIDEWARNISNNPTLQSLLFFAVLGFMMLLTGIPFSYYSTFVIEEKYGFNKSSKKTFWIDQLKSLLLGALIGGIVLALLSYFYLKLGSLFWIVGTLTLG